MFEINTCDVFQFGTIIVALIHAIGYNMRRSRCKQLDCLCIKCERDIMNSKEMSIDDKNVLESA